MSEPPKIVGMYGSTMPDGSQKIEGVELEDGTTLPVGEVTPRMWAAAGIKLIGEGASEQ